MNTSIGAPASEGQVTIKVRLPAKLLEQIRNQSSRNSDQGYPHGDKEDVHAPLQGMICFTYGENKNTGSMDHPTVFAALNGLGEEIWKRFQDTPEYARLIFNSKIKPMGFVPLNGSLYPDTGKTTSPDLVFGLAIQGKFRGTRTMQPIAIGTYLRVTSPTVSEFLEKTNMSFPLNIAGDNRYAANLVVEPVLEGDSMKMAREALMHINIFNDPDKKQHYVNLVGNNREEASMFESFALNTNRFVLTTIAHGVGYLLEKGILSFPVVHFRDDFNGLGNGVDDSDDEGGFYYTGEPNKDFTVKTSTRDFPQDYITSGAPNSKDTTDEGPIVKLVSAVLDHVKESLLEAMGEVRYRPTNSNKRRKFPNTNNNNDERRYGSDSEEEEEEEEEDYNNSRSSRGNNKRIENVKKVIDGLVASDILEKLSASKELNDIFKSVHPDKSSHKFVRKFLSGTDVVSSLLENISLDQRQFLKEQVGPDLIHTVIRRPDEDSFIHGYTQKFYGEPLDILDHSIRENQINSWTEMQASLSDAETYNKRNIIGRATESTNAKNPYQAYYSA